MSRERTRSGPGAHQERAGAYNGWARSIPGVGRERPMSRPGTHQEWARFTGSGARQGPAAKSCFSRGSKTIFFFLNCLRKVTLCYSRAFGNLFGVQVVGAGVNHERTRDGQKPNGVGQEQPE